MRTTRNATLLALLMFTVPCARAESDVKFGPSYPLTVTVESGHKVGAVIYETPYSIPPSENYDTVLIQGTMPDPAMRIELVVRPKPSVSTAAVFKQPAFRRFPNGRFWARYTVPLTRQPLKLRVVNLGAHIGSRLSIYEAELFVARSVKETRAPGDAVTYVPDPALSLPETAPFKLVRRAAWQALPPTVPYVRHAPFYFTLHHTQGDYPLTYQASVSEVLFVQDYHQNGKRWIDIGYHFVIDPAGNIFEGRPILAEGAHVLSHNPGNIGISILGNYHPPSTDEVTRTSLDSFVSVGSYLKDTYAVNVSSFYAHRDIGNTDCPGDNLYARKPELSALIFGPLPQPVTPADAPPLTPAQQKALNYLKTSLNY